MVESSAPTPQGISALSIAESIRGAVNLVLSELDTFGGNGDVCRYMEIADACPAFAMVTTEGASEAVDLDGWATFDIPVVNGPTARVLVIMKGGR